jgi:hypothetical protein
VQPTHVDELASRHASREPRADPTVSAGTAAAVSSCSIVGVVQLADNTAKMAKPATADIAQP